VANRKCCPETRGEVLAQLGIGPFRVKEVVGKCAYRWEHLSGVSIPTTWNASNLSITVSLLNAYFLFSDFLRAICGLIA